MSMNDKRCEISYVVTMYNPKWIDLKETLDSIVIQRDVTFEIIIADDGSEDNFAKKIEKYFKRRNLSNYQLVLNSENQGTVKNLISGLSIAKGKYVKDISPGDYLYDQYTMRNWLDFMRTRNLDWSFSEAIYYSKENGKKKVLVCNAHPNDLRPYKNSSMQQCRWNYVALKDIALGATMLCKTEIQYDYCKKIEGKVIYAEDNIWRIMMFDGVKSGYYPVSTIWYEYGVGVSTSNNDAWKKCLLKDWEATDEIMYNCNEGELDIFQKQMKKAYVWSNHMFLKFFIKGNVLAILKQRIFPRKTQRKRICSK